MVVKIEKFLGVYPGEQAPDFTFTTTDGATRKLSDYRGQVVLLDFWATWCSPCLAQMPHIKQALEQFGQDKKFVVLGVSLDSEEQLVKSFIADKKITWDITVQGPAEINPIAKLYNVSMIPATFLIDANGKVVAVDITGEKLINQLKNLIK
ncbi:MAG: Thiol-disulfide oxidoreductase ResA [Phycisphaerae bacterium]|nr:Thiol-disulfide oxidoreductase ResA [Phycisphaerae bacterium]